LFETTQRKTVVTWGCDRGKLPLGSSELSGHWTSWTIERENERFCSKRIVLKMKQNKGPKRTMKIRFLCYPIN